MSEPHGEASEADWLEQQADDAVVGSESDALPMEADSADVAEQQQEVPQTDEEELVVLDDDQLH